jgi:ABC-type nitrate/sulfonate/bicarbonate transport system substrate-binding protein
MVLWVTDKTNPDEAPCLARLAYARCDVGRADDAPVETGEALRYFAGNGVTALYTVSPTGGVSIEVRFAGALGIASGVSHLGYFPWLRAIWQGVGVDKARVYDINARAHRELGNVFLIPEENLTPRARSLCPADR